MVCAQQVDAVADCERRPPRIRSLRPNVGAGIHSCVGAPLARMEAEVAFEQIPQQRPALALARPSEPPSWRKLINLRGLETLELRNGA